MPFKALESNQRPHDEPHHRHRQRPDDPGRQGGLRLHVLRNPGRKRRRRRQVPRLRRQRSPLNVVL